MLPGMPPEATAEGVRPAVVELMRQAWLRRLFPVYLHGKTGTGKSCAAAVAVRGWWESEIVKAAQQDREPWKPKWWDWSDLCDTLARIRTSPTKSITQARPDGVTWELFEGNLVRTLTDTKLLVIDDIGTAGDTDLRVNLMRHIIDGRNGKPTIITGNVDLRAMAQLFDDRIVSRMSRGQWIKFEGVDRRGEGFGARSKTVKV